MALATVADGSLLLSPKVVHCFPVEFDHPSGFELPAANGSGLLDACHQPLEVLWLHSNLP